MTLLSDDDLMVRLEWSSFNEPMSGHPTMVLVEIAIVMLVKYVGEKCFVEYFSECWWSCMLTKKKIHYKLVNYVGKIFSVCKWNNKNTLSLKFTNTVLELKIFSLTNRFFTNMRSAVEVNNFEIGTISCKLNWLSVFGVNTVV